MGTKVKQYGVATTYLIMIDATAVYCVVRAVEDVVQIVDQGHSIHPVIDLVRPVEIRRVSRDPEKSSRNLEEARVRNGTLVIITSVRLVELPFQSTIAGCGVPA